LSGLVGVKSGLIIHSPNAKPFGFKRVESLSTHRHPAELERKRKGASLLALPAAAIGQLYFGSLPRLPAAGPTGVDW